MPDFGGTVGKIMIRPVRILGALFLFTAFSSLAFGQVGGSISGTVKDSSGGVVPGVSVTATNTVLGTMFPTVTDAQGNYTLPKLPVAKYDVTMTLEGFKPQKRTGIQVDSDSALQINVTLEIGEQSETVTVSVNAVRVDTVRSEERRVVRE